MGVHHGNSQRTYISQQMLQAYFDPILDVTNSKLETLVFFTNMREPAA
jgi:hypothetical protein